jgi:aspartyl-tRNA(Asn)/glutamyl-tRNA(Gln) amidotransferase subunit B
MTWTLVIGCEVHCQLATDTKLFCACSTQFGAEPNTQVCPVCAGHPGVLPVLNAAAVELATRAGRALHCDVQPTSEFSRKNYFYPDLPKGYQITQFARPICLGGHLDIVANGEDRRIGLTRIHIEEDAGKLIHDTTGTTVDLNRAGTPLIEIVSEPDLRTADEVVAYLKALRNIVRWLGVSDGHMEQGSFRCDANVSVRRGEQAPLGTRVEIKNLNSFMHVKRAIEYEAARQISEIEAGSKVIQQTRLWDDRAGVTRAMRSKEEAMDYRYFPEPDLPLLQLSDNWDSAPLPELPHEREARYRDELGLSPYDAKVLTAEQDLSEFYEAVLASGAAPKLAANWVQSELLGRLNSDGLSPSQSPISPEGLGEILERLADKRLSGKLAKVAFTRAYDGEDLTAIFGELGEQVVDPAAIIDPVKELITANPSQVEKYLAGNTNLIGWFIGQIMKSTGGRANPQVVRKVLIDVLESCRE